MAKRFYSREGLACLQAATADAQARGKAINGGAGQRRLLAMSNGLRAPFTLVAPQNAETCR
jgi:hypothetical protein